VQHAPTLPLYRFSVEQYLTMIENGVLSSDDRVELIDGWIGSKKDQEYPEYCSHGVLLSRTFATFSGGW
jgi:hypothetical protein